MSYQCVLQFCRKNHGIVSIREGGQTIRSVEGRKSLPRVKRVTDKEEVRKPFEESWKCFWSERLSDIQKEELGVFSKSCRCNVSLQNQEPVRIHLHRFIKEHNMS